MASDKDHSLDLGDGDVAVLNYAYALEQLEAEFYGRVIDNPFKGLTSQEERTFVEIRDHEIAHREFLKKALGGQAISAIDVDFSTINFDDRANVLGYADTLRILG